MIDKMRDITYDIINCALEVHRSLGPGLLESVYQKVLVHELKLKNFYVESELSIDVEYKGINVANGPQRDKI